MILTVAQQRQFSNRIARDETWRQSHGPVSSGSGSRASTLDHYPFSANGIREVPRRGPAHAQHTLHNSLQGDPARVPPSPKAPTHLLLPATTAPEGAQGSGSQGSGQGQRS